MAGIEVPADTKVLIAEETNFGKEYPFSIEKLSPILAFYTANSMEEASEIAVKLLEVGGLGHTLGIHANSEKVVEAFTVDKPVSRIIVNSGTTFGGIGATVALNPSLTLGCGSFGNNIVSENITAKHLLNIKRVAYGNREMSKAEEKSAVTAG